ncbi:TSC22 domain family protein 4 isoform X1 [Cyprinodon tularosa]|uniref:TSC22 domain family protein 4 isoform X1 n=2 Tax=Cyprinodon tularosa TaxID=77115 RepID=UPI0018E256C8|nr:TSC22 domain family protein 4 isoform X1 [Cyprinodon tularosa]
MDPLCSAETSRVRRNQSHSARRNRVKDDWRRCLLGTGPRAAQDGQRATAGHHAVRLSSCLTRTKGVCRLSSVKMSGTKRKSGFQITSVTSDSVHLTSPINQSSPRETLPNQSGHSSSISPQGSSSQPTTPSSKKKYISHDALGQRASSPSRFRLVRLTEGGASSSGRGSYRRGRWTCKEFKEQFEGAGMRWMMDSLRNAHSLDSLDIMDLEKGGVTPQYTSCPLALPSRGIKGVGLVSPSGPPSPTQPETNHLVKDKEPIRGPSLEPAPTTAPPRPQNFPLPLRPYAGTPGQPSFRMSQSLPGSPPTGRCRPSLMSLHPPSASSLDQTVFIQQEDSRPASPAIDSKIQQAMDLTKSHLMVAVREEVELLKEHIRDLQEKNQQLERENHVLRALTRHYYPEK